MAMFHDQGLPVLKFAGFGQAVNVTLGLPFVRTSVDHGTALDLAATGGPCSSFFQALLTRELWLIGAWLMRARKRFGQHFLSDQQVYSRSPTQWPCVRVSVF